MESVLLGAPHSWLNSSLQYIKTYASNTRSHLSVGLASSLHTRPARSLQMLFSFPPTPACADAAAL